jgi:hypothetical protein
MRNAHISEMRSKHLKVLSLANTDICGPAVEGLAILLSSVTELEELNLSSNNLMLEDFRNLQSHIKIYSVEKFEFKQQS